MGNRFIPVCVSVGLRNGHVGVVCWLEDELHHVNSVTVRTPPRASHDVCINLPIEIWFEKSVKHIS